MKRLLITLLMALSFGSPAQARRPVIIQAKVEELRPGQTSAGYKEVEIKLNHFLSHFDLTLSDYVRLRRQNPNGAKMRTVLSSARFENFLSSRAIRVVRDPRGELHIVDGHHLALSLYRLHIEWADVELLKDFLPDAIRLTPRELDRAMREFEEYMSENGYVYLKGSDGKSIKMADLPRTIDDVTDDPFRSLAWLLKKGGLYEDAATPFQEFAWSEFLKEEFERRGWQLDFTSDSAFMMAVNHALEVADQADQLPSNKTFLEKPKHIRKTCERLLGAGS